MKYRPEIDGLRALAVVPVILFHAGFELFSGGFVGVDVFFVISGYLITSLLIEDVEQNRFSISEFYERRARRILPALFLVMLVCIPFAWLWMLPNQMKDFSQSLVAVSLFASNFLFWTESGYFGADAEEKPLLHTWSLAVEEQYYILFPIFLFLAWRFGARRVFILIAIFAAASLAFSEWAWRNESAANFYLFPSRAWELLAGSITALIIRSRGIQQNKLLAGLGLFAVVLAICVFDARTPFPSLYTLLPVVGVVLIILYSNQTFVEKILGARIFVGIGLISYSAYLWHQPFFAFAKIKLDGHPSPYLLGFLALASLVAATISYKFIEQPFRRRKGGLFSRKAIFALSIAGLSGFILVGFQGHKNDGFKGRFEIPESVYNSIMRTERQRECFDIPAMHEAEYWNCRIGSRSTEPTVFVFGDSHSLSFLPAIDSAGEQMGFSGYFAAASGCTPLLSIHALRNDQVQINCNLLNKRVFDFVKKNRIERLILVARWTYYTDGGYSGNDFSYISLQEDDVESKQVSRKAFEKGLLKTIEAYKKIGAELTIVLQVPEQKNSPLDLFAASTRPGESIASVSISREEHEKFQSYVNEQFARVGVRLLDFTETFCAAGRCPVGTDNISYYFDDDHLSLEGSSMLETRLVEHLKGI